MNKLVPVHVDGQKFKHREVTADGAERASVTLSNPETLWFNTGTLCNIACPNCYIHSSPSNDRLVYINSKEV
ncbi:MAG: radical SAM protein, partial [Paracoccaceae bacterium]